MTAINLLRLTGGCAALVSTRPGLRIAAWCLAGVFGAMGTASAQTITLYSNSGASNTSISIPFTILSLGINSTPQTFVQSSAIIATSPPTTSAPATLPAGAEISSIAFGTGSSPSGVFAGGVAGQAATPFGSTDTNTDYLVAGGTGSVTVSYTVTQDALQILWGSVDGAATSNNNIITFMNGATAVKNVNGYQIALAVGTGFVTGTTNVALRISGLPGFNSVVLSDPGSPAFEFALGLPVPEPASIGLLGLAATGVGFVSRRARIRRARSAA